jgi:hypothetical protein
VFAKLNHKFLRDGLGLLSVKRAALNTPSSRSKLCALAMTAELTSPVERQKPWLGTAMKRTDDKSLKAVVAKFRRRVARHRARRSSEERIRQILGEAIHLAFQEVKDPEERAWLCEEFDKAARVGDIVVTHPARRKLH